MNHVSKIDFAGQQIYVGMDVHKKSWSISIYTDQFEHKTFSQPPEVGVLMNYFKRNFPGHRLRTHAFINDQDNAAFFVKEDCLLIEDWL